VLHLGHHTGAAWNEGPAGHYWTREPARRGEGGPPHLNGVAAAAAGRSVRVTWSDPATSALDEFACLQDMFVARDRVNGGSSSGDEDESESESES
jgi:hypothetical protein